MSFEGLKTFFDSRQFPSGDDFDFDICIIGGGPAGISIAREFANSDTRVVLLESGGLWLDDEIEALNTLEVTGYPYDAEGTRLRFFGGSANHWGGHCAPMTPQSLGKRDWIPHSGWPFGINELKPYYDRAHKVLEIGPYDYRPEAIAERVDENLLPFNPEFVQTQVSRFNTLNFGMRYADELDSAENVSVFLYATVTSINLDEHKRFVSDVTVKTLAQNSFHVRARVFILATGGIENARLLLLSNNDIPEGLGNQNHLVGRYFMEHIVLDSGFILPFDQRIETVQLYEREIYCEDDYDVRGFLILSPESVKALGIPEYRAKLDIRHSRRYFPSIRSYANFRRFLKTFDLDHLRLEDFANVLSDLDSPLRYLSGDDDAPFVYGFSSNCEQCPNPDSRVSLGERRDAFGQRMTKLHWEICLLDIEGIALAERVIAREVGRSEIGRMKVFLPETVEHVPPGIRGARHHIGTTRMDTNPSLGVVDANCRIHGVENIFVAGSSVFPTGGFPNPTLTLVALAIRLADHIKTGIATP